ncbi:mannitol-1-phosphate 5-dehydrogenase [Radiobacillus kanasensis]|uniref:mannitol-1-phosphate 5-dehydrogenase n=1 Tax=Radiobacillus kanasensis TaxID=2844358 RepID=UPI001E515413|nr:mannitol-1-phosphate 5-dehydrogenase [Radiobacillus kanasensis]UFT99165.1 mannitol-1-phosphate 5-dehydrogenase [Radiobacillus kanasensis]
MQAVHFGAGNIGRGFIGLLLYQSGFHTTFVDVNKTVIDALNERKRYSVTLSDENSEKLPVENVQGINSGENPDAVIQAIAEADIVTTAVGPNILPIIADLIAKGLQQRYKQSKKALDLIACENMIGGSSLLKEKVFEKLSNEEQQNFESLFGFPNAAVDRIVPNQVNEDVLAVSVEPYYEWVVDQSQLKAGKLDIAGLTYVPDLAPYIERKLFTVNTGHAVVAYLGAYLGFQTIKDAIDAEQVEEILQGTLEESGSVLVKQYGFDQEQHKAYIEKIINRFKNPYISDEVNRVGRAPLRKLGPNDRLIRPASLYQKLMNNEPVNLSKTIAAALQYEDPGDEEAVKLQSIVKEKGYKGALMEVAELEEGNKLLESVLKQTDALAKLK